MYLCLVFRCQGIFFAPDLLSTKDYKYARRTSVSNGPFMLCSVSMLFFFCFHGLLPPISNVAPSHREILAVNKITVKLKLVCFPQPTMTLDILISLQYLYIFFSARICYYKKQTFWESKMLIMFHESDTLFVQLILYSTIGVSQITFRHLATQKWLILSFYPFYPLSDYFF